MLFYKNIYLDEKTKKNKKKIIWKLRHNAGQLNIFLITAAGNDDLFDIIHCAYLKQKDFPKDRLYVLGLASGYDSAVELAVHMVEDFSHKYEGFQFKQTILEADDFWQK